VVVLLHSLDRQAGRRFGTVHIRRDLTVRAEESVGAVLQPRRDGARPEFPRRAARFVYVLTALNWSNSGHRRGRLQVQ
jgi:hypothetical protein